MVGPVGAAGGGSCRTDRSDREREEHPAPDLVVRQTGSEEATGLEVDGSPAAHGSPGLSDLSPSVALMTSAAVQERFGGLPVPLYRASPARLLAWLDCPRRYRMAYLERPSPPRRPQRAHTSIGMTVHASLRAWWDLPLSARTPASGRRLVEQGWIDVGFRDAVQSAHWKTRTSAQVTAYLEGLDSRREPLGVERVVGLRTGLLALSGRIDRLDDRDGELVVVDYKTGRRPPTPDEPASSLPLALYAAAVSSVFRRPCRRVELHHVPSGQVAADRHTDESLQRKVREADSIGRQLQAVDAHFAKAGDDPSLFAPRVSPLCRWCDYRAWCPQGQQAGPEKSSWAALEGSADEQVVEEHDRDTSDQAKRAESPAPA